MNIRQLTFSAIAVALQVPMITFAAGLVPCGGSGEQSCQTCHVVQLIDGVNVWLVGILSVVAAIMFVIAGFRLVTSNGNPSVMTDAKNMILNVMIGFVIVLSAWLIVDMAMKALLIEGDAGFGPWNQIACIEQPEAMLIGEILDLEEQSVSFGSATGQVLSDTCDAGPGGNTICDAQKKACSDGDGVPKVVTDNPTNHVVECSYPATAGYGGSCSQIADASNPCHTSNLSMFGARAAEASVICSKESGGKAVKSRSDICCGPGGNCSGAPSFSGGYFQINVLAHADKIPNCSAGAFYAKNCVPGKKCGTQGSCVKRNGEGICTGWSCSITNRNMYNDCMKVTENSSLNFDIAEDLFNNRGQKFNDWSWSAKRCGVSF